MKIIIFRTIAHTRIWEQENSSCYYDYSTYNNIVAWEPNLKDINLDDAIYGIGLYTSKYFSYITRSGVKSYNGTIEETKPSLLKLKAYQNDSNAFIHDQSNKLKFYYSFIKKFDEFDIELMNDIDSKLVHMKKAQIGDRVYKARYDSLCFSLNYREVENLLATYGSKIP